MNCAQVRFFLYAYLDRDISSFEADAVSRHLVDCAPCRERGRSARGLAQVLRSRMERFPAPTRLRLRLRQGDVPRFRYPLLATAAVLLVLLVPLVADDVSGPPSDGLNLAAGASLPRLAGPPQGPLHPQPTLVSRRMTGTLVCLDCDARAEAGLCPLPHARHEDAFCADNGELWRLMSRNPGFSQGSAGQTLTLEGVGFPRSGFLRASRVGY
jgi:putative zinc finger protein